MNYDPNKAIRQALMVARRQAANGGQQSYPGYRPINPLTGLPEDEGAEVVESTTAPRPIGSAISDGGNDRGTPGPQGAPGTGNFVQDVTNFGREAGPALGGMALGGLMGGPAGAVMGAVGATMAQGAAQALGLSAEPTGPVGSLAGVVGNIAQTQMGMTPTSNPVDAVTAAVTGPAAPGDQEDADQGNAQTAGVASSQAGENADNANSMSEATTTDAAGPSEGPGAGSPGPGSDFARGGDVKGGMDPRSLPGIHLKTNHRFADGGGVQPEEEEGFDAYHGSPHEFEQFDSSKIGTGEGAQAFGYGHYLAENEGVARQYRNKLAPTTLVTQSGAKHAYSSSAADEIAGDLLKGASPQIRYPVEHALGLMMRGSILDSAISKMRSDYDHFDPKNLDEAERLLRQHNPDPISSGHMYHVRVKAKPEHFLDWDAPLSEQHPQVVQALNQTFPSAMDYWRSVEGKGGDNGGHFHAVATEDLTGSAKKGHKEIASKLQAAGIPGIKYFDRDSRSAGEGTRNYVIFDPDMIQVKRRYADGGEIMPRRDLGADPTVQRAMDVTAPFSVSNPMSVFPKPQRMWEDQRPGGAYLAMPTKEDITGHKAAQAEIGVNPGGKPFFNVSRDAVEETGSPGRGSATVKTNLFKQKAGWQWAQAPEGHEDTNTLVSINHRGKHHYALNAQFPKGVDLARYENAPTEPRLRPTTKGNVELGEQVGTIMVRGKEHPVYRNAIVRNAGGAVGYADGGMPGDDPVVQQAMDITRQSQPSAPQMARQLNEQGMYSHAAEVAAGLPQAKGSPQQMLAMLSSRGVKPDEIKHSGVQDTFGNQKVVTKDQLAQHFQQNVPGIAETVLYRGGENAPRYEKYQLPPQISDKYDEKFSAYDSALLSALHERGPQKLPDLPKTQKNYREVLLLAKPKDGVTHSIIDEEKANDWLHEYAAESAHQWGDIDSKKEWDEAPKETKDWHLEIAKGRFNENLMDEAFKEQFLSKDAANIFESSHWNYPNVLGHIRMSDKDGGKTLHIEEFQSDWGQAKRNGKDVPDHPLINNTNAWTDMLLKRALREAAQGDYDRIAWTGGQDQVERYNLNKVESGEGMKSYYDKIVPTRIVEVAKKLGFPIKIEPHKIVTEKGEKTLHSIKVTPELKDAVMRGMPAYNTGGAVGYADGGMPGDDPTVQRALDLTRNNDVSPVAAARSVALGETYGGQNAPAYSEAGTEAGRLPIGRSISGSEGILPSSHQAPLEGLPTRVKVPLTGEIITAGPNHQVRAIAEQYMRDAGLPYNPPRKYAKVDPDRGKRIADEYTRMSDDADHPLVKAAYDAMVKETMAQYRAAKAGGLKLEFWNPDKEKDPYEASPRLAIEDVNKNHHMYIFPTNFGFGEKEISPEDIKRNPLLADSGERWNGIPVTVNDLFRAVHDYFGHAKEGVGFRGDGEENAWRSHAAMYSPLARLALTSETRGQNSWLNYGPHGEKNRNARTEDTVFADQKVGVMPPWTTHEGAEDFIRPEDREAIEKIYKKHHKARGGSIGYADGGMPGGDPTVQRAMDITRGAQPTAPDMARQTIGQSSKLASTFQAENRPAVIVSPRPGKIGGPPVQREIAEGLPEDFTQDREPWSYATPNIIGATQPPPVQHPVFNEPRMEKITNATRQIFKNKDFHSLIRDLTGLQGLNITPTVGTWKNEMEPSFILSHPDMTDEHAEKLAHLLGFGFQQDAILQSKHNPDIENGAPAVLMGTGKKLTAGQIDAIHHEATKHGIDFTVTGDGKAAKFVHLGDQAGLEDFYGKIKNISDVANLPELYHAKTTGKLIDAQSYLDGIFGSPGGEVRDQTGTGRSPDLFRRIVNHVLAPYAKAVAGEGYRLSPERLTETYALNDEESGHVRGALYPGKKDDRTTIPLMTGEEQLDVRPTGARGRASVGDVLYALQNRAAAKGQIDPGDFSDNAKNDIAQNIAKEVAYHVQNSDKSAIGWYDDALKQAMTQYAGRFPELGTDPQKTMLFHAILGITSQGNDVYSNSIHAMRLYDQIQNGGKSLPEAVANLKGSFGDKTRAIETNLMKLHHLLDTNGYDRMSNLFNQTKTVSEWNNILRKDKNLRSPNGENLEVEGGSGQKVTGWMVFGPKIGSFINNLHGDYSTLTADLWFSRTWNRLLGHNFIHTPLAEAKQYRDFRDALRAEYYSSNPNIGVSPIPKTEDGKLVYDKKGRPKPWEYGNDAPALSKEEFDDLLNDPDKMLNFAQDITKRYRDSGFKDKSDLRRRAKNWIENRELPVAVPRGDLERQFQQDTVEEAQRLLKKKYGMNISVADIQAALWFHEKELFGKLGVASEKAQPADYADAARRTISLIDSGDLYLVKSKEKAKKAKPQEEFAFGGTTMPMRDSAVVQRALRLTSANRPMAALADLFQRQLRGRQ